MKERFAVLIVACLLLITLSAGAEADYGRFASAGKQALGALDALLEAQYNSVYVYKDFGDTENHFTQKAKMFGFDDSLVLDMDENWRENPHSGESCIRCDRSPSRRTGAAGCF